MNPHCKMKIYYVKFMCIVRLNSLTDLGLQFNNLVGGHIRHLKFWPLLSGFRNCYIVCWDVTYNTPLATRKLILDCRLRYLAFRPALPSTTSAKILFNKVHFQKYKECTYLSVHVEHLQLVSSFKRQTCAISSRVIPLRRGSRIP